MKPRMNTCEHEWGGWQRCLQPKGACIVRAALAERSSASFALDSSVFSRVHPWHVPPRRGMTLLEVLIALGLMLALLGALFGFFFNAIDSRERVLEMTAQQRAAATLIESIEKDLIFTVVGDSRFGAGVSGDETTLRVLTRGVSVHLAERGSLDPRPFMDLQKAEYRFSRSRGIEMRRANASDGTDGLEFEPLEGSIFRVQFRYHDGERWSDTYDSMESGALPVAVEVAVWFHAWPGAADVDEEQDVELDDEAADAENERLTFTPQDTFDESEWAQRGDRNLFEEQLPPPDRVRVVIVPDAREEAP